MFAVSGLAAGAIAATRAGLAAPAVSAPTAPVAVAKVASYTEDLVGHFEKMFDQIGGLGNQVRGKTVGIKINGVGGAGFDGLSAGQTTAVHPNLVTALVVVLGKNGAKRVRILESSGREGALLEDRLLQGGWDINAIKTAAPIVEFEDTNGMGQGKQYATLKVKYKPYVFPAFMLNHSYADCDFFISAAKLKNHEEMGLTLSMKNLFGTTPTLLYGQGTPPQGAIVGADGDWSPNARERVFHYGQAQSPSGAPQEINPKSPRYEGWRLPRVLVDLSGARTIDLAVIDGIQTIVGGENRSIPGTKPANPGLLVVGRNCVCTDTVACALMGYNPRGGRDEPPWRVFKGGHGRPANQYHPPDFYRQYADNIMLLAEAAGMGSADLSKIEVRGTQIKDAVFEYDAVWKGQLTPGGEKPTSQGGGRGRGGDTKKS